MCDNCCTPFIEGEGCASALQKRASNVASGDYSIATGHGTIASNEGEMSTGNYNKPNDGQVFSVGVGTSDSNRMNAIQVNKDGSTSFLYNGRIVKLTELIRNVSPSGQITLDVRNGYIVVSYDGGQTYHNLIAISELKGDPGITSVTAQIDSSTQELGVRATLSNGVLTLIFSGLQGGGGSSNVAALNDLTDVTITSASNGQALVYRNGIWKNETIEGGGGDTPTPGEPGRSITGTQQWFKLSDSLSVTAPALSIADPSSAAGGSWTTSQLNTTEQLPYLWTFIQYNYDKVLDTGYMYSRSSAWRVSNYNADPSQEYEDLQRSIAGIYAELRADLDQYGVDLQNLSNALASLRTSVEGTITTELNRLRDRLASIDASELKIIEDDGLWYLMTSWTDQTGAKKAFADILADAQNAKIALDAGSTFFGANGHVGITLNGIESALSATATKSYVDSAIASAQFSVDPASLQSVISKGQQCWEKNGVLYPYTLHINDGSGFQNLVDYETYMEKNPTQGGPSSDAHGPAGPFTLVAVIGQISQIKQTADSISASVSELQYMWRNGNDIYDFFDDDLATAYNNRDMNLYSGYDYETYISDVLGYEKVQVSELLSGVTQKADEIEAIVGKVDKIWSKPKASGGYEYQKYAVPSNKTASQYETEMRNAGWTLTTYADEFGVFSLTDDKIALAVKKSKYVWIDDSLAADNANYCKDYDAWLSTYESSSYSGTYEQYVAQYHPSYTLTRVADSMSQIKQESNRITSAVASINTLGSRVSSVEQTASNISASVANMKKVWKNSTTGDIKDYEAYRNAYNSSGSSTPYESWVPANYSGYALSEVATELGGLSIKSDKIWAGVGDGQGNVAASIGVIKDMAATRLWKKNGQTFKYDAFYTEFGEYAEVDGTMTYQEWMAYNGYTLQSGSAIVLTADNVYVDGTLISPIANLAGFKFENERIESQSLDNSDNPNIIIDGNNGTLTANDATIRGEINALSGAIGALEINHRGFSGTFADSTTIISTVYDLENKVNINENKIEFSSKSTGRSSGNVMASGTMTIGMESSNMSGGFVDIDCTKRSDIVDSSDVPRFNCGLKVTAENAANAIEADGNVFVDGTLAGQKSIVSNDPRVEEHASSSKTLTYKNSGCVIDAYDDITISISGTNTLDRPGFNFRVIRSSLTATVSVSITSTPTNWYIIHGGSVSVQTTMQYTLPSADSYEVIYVGKMTENDTEYNKMLVVY